MSKKNSTIYVCCNCSYQVSKWMGKCPECNEWNSFEEEIFDNQIANFSKKSFDGVTESPKLINNISLEEKRRTITGIGEFDRVMGGGIVPGTLILIGGEPGIGKSTLLTEIMGRLAKKIETNNILYVSGEESSAQVANRAKRIGIICDNYFIYHETLWEKIKEEINKLKPSFIVIDSIQTTLSQEIQSPPGTVSQIRDVTYEILNLAKANNITCFIIGHITKEGSIAGPKILEHMVDTVIYFEGDQLGHYRILRCIKNRFGNTNEIGIFEMSDKGLLEVKNPSQYFLGHQLSNSFGRSLTCIIEGSRPLFVETQALVVENKFGNGRRTTQGLDHNRLSMLIAVIEKYFGIPLGLNDVYLNVVGGIKLASRESDLSIIASILSSYKSRPLPNDTIFLGEVGLTSEVRSVPQVETRLREMEQLNYKRVLTSYKTMQEYQDKYKIKIIGLTKANEIEDICFI